MENNNNKKQQQSYSRSINAKPSLPAESNRKSSDLQVNNAKRNSRRREQISTPRNEQQNRNSKQQQQQLRPYVDKRPRPRGDAGSGNANNTDWRDAANDVSSRSSDDYFAGGSGLAASGGFQKSEQFLDYSVYAPGSKKHNLNHLLNFHYTPHGSDNTFFSRGSGGSHQRHYNANGGGSRKHRYNKEQFLQANFQFVIRDNSKPLMTASPDALIDWNLIEQINIQTSEEPQCPICLYPPVAAKLTRCGHAYCWPCLLHYLSLSDKSWRKCPICYEAIHVVDLKSCTIMQQRVFNVGDEITFQLMRRRKGSMYIERFSANTLGNDAFFGVERFPLICKDDEAKRYSKFLIARRSDIVQILERERRELLFDEDPSCPEHVFIQQALTMLNERREKLGVFDIKEDDMEHNDDKVEMTQEQKYALNKSNLDLTNKSVEELGDVDHSSSSAASVISSNDENSSILIEDKNLTTSAVGIGDEATLNAASACNKYYYFYQSNDGQNIYLHPINVKMLQACYGTLDRAPLFIASRIVQKEQHSMDEEHRRKFTCLGHLPLTCQFAVIEVDLQPPIVGVGILKLFKDDLIRRKQDRQRREREERKREKQINEINDRQMGKFIASTANINIGSAEEFPTWGFEETLPALPEERSGIAIATSSSKAVNQQHSTSYSTVAVVGGSPKRETWPTIGGAHSSAHASFTPPSSSGGAWGCAAPSHVTTNAPKNTARMVQTDSDLEPRPMTTRLSDVLAEAISQKQQTKGNSNTPNSGNGGKKHKKSKKMTPIFATGMNFNGN